MPEEYNGDQGQEGVTQISQEQEVPTPPKSIAIVSGKGGSGKTMVSAVVGELLGSFHSAIIVDADTGTGGMTYYLGLKQVQNTSVGLSDVAIAERKERKDLTESEATTYADPLVLSHLQPIHEYDKGQFFGIGNHRRLYREVREEELPGILSHVVRSLRESELSWIVADCRGGIDRESIAVCREVDDILLVVEPDTTSFQATQYLVEILADNDLSYKLRGFIINKVFDNPKHLELNGSASFNVRHLSSIPYDLAATQDFYVGEIPSKQSLFGIHVWKALNRAYPNDVPEPSGRTWRHEDFERVGLANIDSLRGGTIVAGAILLVGIIFLFTVVWLPGGYDLNELYNNPEFRQLVYVLMLLLLLGLIGSIEITRRAVGKLVEAYVRTTDRILTGRRRS